MLRTKFFSVLLSSLVLAGVSNAQATPIQLLIALARTQYQKPIKVIRLHNLEMPYQESKALGRTELSPFSRHAAAFQVQGSPNRWVRITVKNARCLLEAKENTQHKIAVSGFRINRKAVNQPLLAKLNQYGKLETPIHIGAQTQQGIYQPGHYRGQALLQVAYIPL